MTEKILEILQLYLAGNIDLDSLEYQIIPLAWDTGIEDQDLIDQIAVELAYIKDGVSEESIFRARIVEVVMSKQIMTIVLNDSIGESQVTWRASNHNSSIHITYQKLVAPIEYQFNVQPGLQPVANTQAS